MAYSALRCSSARGPSRAPGDAACREENMCALSLVGPARGLSALLIAGALISPNAASAADPIRVGMSMALTGGVAPIGKQVLTALQIWRDDVNAKGGL